MSQAPAIPMCDLQTQFRRLEPQLQDAIMGVLRSGQVILGPEVSTFEAEVSKYCGAAFGVGCSSGSDALLLALAALDIGPGDEVILPPFTFFATAGAICRIGATPVFADIDPITFNIDPIEVEKKITSRTKAIMLVHLFGQCVDMEPIWRTSLHYNVPIIEDAAQAIGAEYHGKRTGTLGGMACFSFYPSKNLGTYGDAGMVVTNDAKWAAKIACLRGHGMEPRYYHTMLGWNARIDAVQAALLRVKLPYLDEWTAQRQAAAWRYDALIEEAGLDDWLTRPTVVQGSRHVFNQYVVRVAAGQRDALVRHLKAERIGCEIYYPVPLHLQRCLKYLSHGVGDFPHSERAAREVLALPMFPDITIEQQRRVIQTCAAFLRQPLRMAA